MPAKRLVKHRPAKSAACAWSRIFCHRRRAGAACKRPHAEEQAEVARLETWAAPSFETPRCARLLRMRADETFSAPHT